MEEVGQKAQSKDLVKEKLRIQIGHMMKQSTSVSGPVSSFWESALKLNAAIIKSHIYQIPWHTQKKSVKPRSCSCEAANSLSITAGPK